MKRKKLWAALTAGALTLMTVAGHVCIADPAGTSPTIDPSRKASLTIYKIAENDGNVYEGNGLENESLNEKSIPGVSFAAVKIADFAMFAKEGGSGNDLTSVSGGFTGLDQDFRAILTDYANTYVPDMKIGTDEYWSSDNLIQALQTACASFSGIYKGEDEVRSFVTNKSTDAGKIEIVSSGDGPATASNMDLGLYLVVETNSGASNPTSPFLVSLPMSTGTGDTNNGWLYEVTVYTKTQSVSVPKYIVSESDGDTLVASEDFEIGDIVHQIIAPSVPAVHHEDSSIPDNRLYETYVVSDTMQGGMSLKKLNDVKIGQLVSNPDSVSDFDAFEKLTPDKDYYAYKEDTQIILTESNMEGIQKFRIELTPTGIAKLNAFTSCGQIVVFFDAVVNSNASLASGISSPVTNEPSLKVKNVNSEEYTVTGNTPSIYTYALDIKKEGLSDPTKASFTVKRGNTDILFAKESNGIYHIFDGVFDTPGSKLSHIEPASSGTLLIKGLDADTYKISEISTESGHELLTSSFEVTLVGKDIVDGDLASATVTAGSVSTNLTVDKGTAGLKISNREALILRTGGAGTTAIYIGAFALLALAGVLTAANLRRREK